MNRRNFNRLSFGAGIASRLPLAVGVAQGQSAAAHTEAKLSVMLWTLPSTLSFEQKLQMVSAAGYRSVEVLNEYTGWTTQEWKRNLAMMGALGMTVDSAAPGRNALADHSKRTALQDDLIRALPGAKRLGCTQFIYTAYTRVAGQTPDQQQAAIVDTLKYAADLLEKDGFELVLEPIDLLEYDKEAVPSVANAFEIVRAVGSSRVKVLYDFYHEQRQAGNLIEKLEKNIGLVGLVHIADVPGRHLPGSGEINYANIYRKLAEVNYSRYICMEFLPQHDAVAELKVTRLQTLREMQSARTKPGGGPL